MGFAARIAGRFEDLALLRTTDAPVDRRGAAILEPLGDEILSRPASCLDIAETTGRI